MQKQFIGGKWLDACSGETLSVVDPSTGEETSFEDVVRMLDNDTISRECGVGVSQSFRQLALVELKTERAKYNEGIAWLQKMTWNTRFDPDRLKVIATKLLNDIPGQKRDGSGVTFFVVHVLAGVECNTCARIYGSSHTCTLSYMHFLDVQSLHERYCVRP